MKKVLLSCALALASIAGFAQYTTVAEVNFSTVKLSEAIDGTTFDESNTTVGGQWTLDGFTNDNNEWNYIATGKYKKKTTATITSTFGIEGAEQMTLTIGGAFNSSSIQTVTVYAATDEDFSDAAEMDFSDEYKAGAVNGQVVFNFSPFEEFQALGTTTPLYYQIEIVTKSNSTITPSASIAAMLFQKPTQSKEAAGLAFPQDSYTVTFGDSFTAPTLTNPHNLTVTYTSSNTDVATVADNGAVTIVGRGTTAITATFAGNDQYKEGDAYYLLNVNAAKATLTWEGLSSSVVVATIGGTNNLPSLSYSPEGITVTCSSSNTDVATVDNEGNITLVGRGFATITAASVANDNVAAATASFNIIVIKQGDALFNLMGKTTTTTPSQQLYTQTEGDVTLNYIYNAGNGYTWTANGMSIAGNGSNSLVGTFEVVAAKGRYVQYVLAGTVANAGVSVNDGAVTRATSFEYSDVNGDTQIAQVDFKVMSAANVRYFIVATGEITDITFDLDEASVIVTRVATDGSDTPASELYWGDTSFATALTVALSNLSATPNELYLSVNGSKVADITAGTDLNLTNVLTPGSQVEIVAVNGSGRQNTRDITDEIKWEYEIEAQGFDPADYTLYKMPRNIVNYDEETQQIHVEIPFTFTDASASTLFELPYQIVTSGVTPAGTWFLHNTGGATELRYVVDWTGTFATRDAFFSGTAKRITGTAQVGFRYLVGGGAQGAPARVEGRAGNVEVYAAADPINIATTLTAKNSDMSGIEDVAIESDSNENVEFYNLQGVRLNAEPENGLYIRRQGKTVTKVVR